RSTATWYGYPWAAVLAAACPRPGCPLLPGQAAHSKGRAALALRACRICPLLKQALTYPHSLRPRLFLPKESLMKPRLLTPGPSPVPEDTLLELAKPVFYHRSPFFRQLLGEVLEDLKYVFCTKNGILPLTASGTGGMEAAVSNLLAPGEKAI